MCYANFISMEALKNVKGVGIMVVHEDEVLLCKRVDNKQWGLPGGGIEFGEEPHEAASRELLEEVNIDIQPWDLTYLGVTISEPNHAKKDSQIGCGVDYLVKFTHKPEINLQRKELSDYQWVKIVDAPGLLDMYPASVYTLLLYLRE